MAIQYCRFQPTELELSHLNGTFIRVSQTKLLESLCGQNLHDIKILDLSYCQLSELPDLKYLTKLESLVLVQNALIDISNIKNESLKRLDVSLNPIETVDINFDHCPEVKVIKVGSEQTKCLSKNLLQRMADGNLFVEFDERYRAQIKVPPQDVIDDCTKKNFNETISHYLKESEFDVSWYVSSDSNSINKVFDELISILSLDSRNIFSFKLSDFRHRPTEMSLNLERILAHTKLHNVEQLSVKNCDLDQLPSFEHLIKIKRIYLSGNQINYEYETNRKIGTIEGTMQFLSHLDLSNNNLTQIPDVKSLKSLENLNINSNRIKDVVNLESRSLRTLLLCENLFHTLDLNVQNLPCLSKIIFGSEACQFVSFQILHRASTGQLELEVTPLYRQNLLMPPLNALDDIQELHNFVKSKEINIRQFNTNQPEQIFQCLTHIVESQTQHYDVLSLTDQATLCKSIGF